jgi:hypothetical protein
VGVVVVVVSAAMVLVVEELVDDGNDEVFKWSLSMLEKLLRVFTIAVVVVVDNLLLFF